ncbi:MAG: DNRLRE domain-containing protein [Thermomicrobiales bacterium]
MSVVHRRVTAGGRRKRRKSRIRLVPDWTLRWRRLPLHGFEAATLAAMMLALSLLNRGPSANALPSQFEDVVVTSVSAPTALAFTPDKRMLITTQSGRLRIYKNGSLLGTAALDISGKTCSDFERGMLGVAVDPSFSANHYVYIDYTFKKFGSCPSNTPQAPVNRLSRFVLGSNDLINPSSETVLVDNMPSPNGNHNAGDIEFGNDGYLYISIGDGGCQIDNSSNCAGNNQDARKQNVLTGKVLRITKTGGIPAGNPFQGSDSGRCNVNGRTSQAKCQETWAWGLRNPFRFAVDPNSSKIYINDVGQNIWEEIDNGQAGRDYGWNVREGFCAEGSTIDCGPQPAGMTNPIYSYAHTSGCTAIAGGAFVPNGIWPSTYDGAYLFSDYGCGKIWRLTGSAGSYSRTEFVSDGNPVHLEFGPYGSTQALYYASYDGTIHRVRFTGQSNRAPVADAKSDKTFGALPLTVSFDCSGSRDPDGDPLTYDWNFGDGSSHSTSCKPSHTYTTASLRTVTLTVRDNRGGSDTDTLKIDAGNTPPSVTITSPSASHLFRVGETISLSGTATDAQDGTISPSTLSWTVILHHSTHTHPFLGPVTGNNTFVTKAPEDLLAATNSYLEIKVTATDSHGLKKTVSQNLNPHKVNVSLNTNPSGLGLTVNSVAISAPDTFVSWEGYDLQVSAPNQLDQSGQGWTFASWSDSGARTHTIDTPGSDSSYTATFSQTRYPGFAPAADSYVVNGYPNSNYGLQTTLNVDYGPNSTAESYFKFNVSGLSGAVSSAKIWIYASSGTSDGPAVYETTNSWSETGITWNNKPAKTTGGRNDRDAIPSHTWVSFDVTPWVSGNGTFSFVLAGKSSDALVPFSRQADDRWPRLEIVTAAGSTDVSPPTVPTNLQVDARAWNDVLVDWNPSSDDVGVVSYDVFRDDHFLTTVSAGTTYFKDTGTHEAETYGYRVRARDAGNVSGLTSSVSVTTPLQTFSYNFSTTVDARVEQAHPTSNYGSSTQLRAEGGSDPGVRSFLKFNVSGLVGNVQSATLWVYIPSGSANGTSNGPRVYKAASSTWSESSVTWNSKPALLTGGYDDKGALSDGAWVHFDVTPFIHANGYATIAIISSSSDSAVFNSSEASSNRPRLNVVTSMAAAASAAAPPVESEPVDGTSPMPSPTAEPPSSTTVEVSATPTPALPFADDFETGNFDKWTTIDGLGLEQQVVDQGVFAAVSANNGTNTVPGKPSFASESVNAEEPNLFASVRYYVQHQDDHTVNVLSLQTKGNQPVVTVFLTSDHKLAYQVAGGAQPVVIDEVQSEVWHSLQVHLMVNGPASQIEIWHDAQLVRRDPVQLGNVKIEALELGEARTGRTYEIYFDDFAVDRQCIGTCPLDLVTSTPAPPGPTEAPTDTPTMAATEKPEPTSTPAPPIETSAPTEAPKPAPTETPESGAAGG